MNRLFTLIMAGAALFAFGCSSHQAPVDPVPQTRMEPAGSAAEGAFWWRCSFRIDWPEGRGVDWGVDLMLAHAVVAPILERRADDIALWRFHRRAARDAAGHQFSFIFYSRPEAAAAVFRDLDDSALLRRLTDTGAVERVLLDDPGAPRLAAVADTSDASWPPALKRNWPYFIMGVSALWLGLIDEAMADIDVPAGSVDELLGAYRLANGQVTDLWQREGQHALLHHLNAVFGYAPLLIRKRMTF